MEEAFAKEEVKQTAIAFFEQPKLTCAPGDATYLYCLYKSGTPCHRPFAYEAKASDDRKHLELKRGYDTMMTSPVEPAPIPESLNEPSQGLRATKAAVVTVKSDLHRVIPKCNN
ncbi:hypothetical protein [Chitinophaga sp. RAB17]|uniref:hypothetical protein n=1 Tax=Chitinophaga sp. RAB17 TaxID=3233049 RepID=UPI003F8EA37F